MIAGLSKNGSGVKYSAIPERAAYRLQALPKNDVAHWDELIAPYSNRQLFHQQAWLDYLHDSQNIDIRYWEIREGSKAVGYFCGGVVRRGPFRILGSPLKGWGTNLMGPLLYRVEDVAGFLQALDDLAQAERFAMVEMEQPSLPEKLLQMAGFDSITGWTYRVPLFRDENAMLKSMPKGRRSGIKKAIRSGLIVENCPDDEIASEFYSQFTGLMHRKGLVPSYPSERPRLLVRHLRKNGSILALRVRHPSGQCLAVGLFPHDRNTLYFWGGASVPDGLAYCPNDLLHWQAMRLAAQLGLCRYDMSGYGRFKKEFGGELITLKRWHKCYWRSARWARRAYEAYFRSDLQVRGWLRSLSSRCQDTSQASN